MTTTPDMKILTNMAFWQSTHWQAATHSIYDPLGQTDPPFLPWWKESLTLWRKAKEYDIIVTMGVRESMLYAALCFITGRPSKQITTEVFIDLPQTPGLRWRLKNKFYAIMANRAIGHLTNSQQEIQTMARRYKVPESRFEYVPLNTTINEPCYTEAPTPLLVAAGRSGRDYACLGEALQTLDLPAQFIGTAPNPAWSKTIKANANLSRKEYLKILRAASIVAIPLLDLPRATGQVVLLEAMALGKPVIATRTTGTKDIVRHEKNGLLVAPNDPEEWRKAIQRMSSDEALRRRLAQQALQDVLNFHTTEQHAQLKLNAIHRLYTEQHPPSD